MIQQPSRYAGGSPRNLSPAQGVGGGLDGIAGAVTINPGSPDEQKYVGIISNVMLQEGDVVRVETGSAGGAGDPLKRDRLRVMNDLRNGYISPQSAVATYGLSEEQATQALSPKPEVI